MGGGEEDGGLRAVQYIMGYNKNLAQKISIQLKQSFIYKIFTKNND